jgi:hypothetical protein
MNIDLPQSNGAGHRVRGSVLLAALLAAMAVLVSGCGAIDTIKSGANEVNHISRGDVDKGWLEGQIAKDVRSANGQKPTVSCVDEGDGLHFTCLATIPSGRSVSYTVSCDANNCLWRPQ